MLGVSTKFQALHIQRCLIGDLGVLFDNVRGGIGIVTVLRIAIDAVLNGNVIVDQIRGGLCQRRPLSIEDRIFSYSNLFLSLVHALRLLIPASEVIALQRGIICAHRGVPARQVIRRIGDRNICRYTGGPIGVIGQLIDIDLTVQVPDVCAKGCFALVTGRAVISFQVHPFADPIEVKVLITVVLHEITACLDLGAQNVLLLWGHGSCCYQLAQRCPTATVSIVCHATFNFDQFVLSVDRLKIDIYRSGREGRIFTVVVPAILAGVCSDRSGGYGFKLTVNRRALFTAARTLTDLLVLTGSLLHAFDMFPFPVVVKRTCILAHFCFSTVGALVHGIALLRAGGGNFLNELVELMVLAVFSVDRVVAEIDAALINKGNLVKQPTFILVRIIPFPRITVIPDVFNLPFSAFRRFGNHDRIGKS